MKNLFLTVLVGVFLAGCGYEARMLGAAERGEVIPQYDLAVYYREERQERKSFQWMKRAAESRYRPAMRELSGYYLRGYGTPKNVYDSAKWLRRYLNAVTDGDLAYDTADQILQEATGKEAMQGLLLLALAIEQEYKDDDRDSEVVRNARARIMEQMEKICRYWLANQSPESAREVLDYCITVAEKYPDAFPPDFFQRADKVGEWINNGKIPDNKEATGRGK